MISNLQLSSPINDKKKLGKVMLYDLHPKHFAVVAFECINAEVWKVHLRWP